MKVCSKCRRQLGLSEFSKNKRYKDGLICWCKGCNNEHRKQYYQSNKDKALDYRKQYYNTNRYKALEYQKQYRETKIQCEPYCYMVWSKVKQAFIYVGRSTNVLEQRVASHRSNTISGQATGPFNQHIVQFGMDDLIFMELPAGKTEHEYAVKYGTYSKCNQQPCVDYR